MRASVCLCVGVCVRIKKKGSGVAGVSGKFSLGPHAGRRERERKRET